jgi:hypothetical protein
LTPKERLFLKIWERFKVCNMLPHEWLTNGEVMEEHVNGLVEMHKLHNKKLEMESELAQRKAASKGGTSVSRGF